MTRIILSLTTIFSRLLSSVTPRGLLLVRLQLQDRSAARPRLYHRPISAKYISQLFLRVLWFDVDLFAVHEIETFEIISMIKNYQNISYLITVLN